MTALGLSLGTVIGQTPATSVSQKSTKPSVQAAAQTKPAPAIPQKAGSNTVAVSNKKSHIKPTHITPVHPIKKDGTPDTRYKENKPASPGSTGNK